MTTVVKCPTCSRPVEWTAESRWRPFCSERCKLIDLGQWAEGCYTVPCEPADPRADTENGQDFTH